MLSLGKITYVQASKQFLLFHKGTAHHQLVSCFDKLLIFQTVAEEKIDEDCIVKRERSPSLQKKKYCSKYNLLNTCNAWTTALPAKSKMATRRLQNGQWDME